MELVSNKGFFFKGNLDRCKSTGIWLLCVTCQGHSTVLMFENFLVLLLLAGFSCARFPCSRYEVYADWEHWKWEGGGVPPVHFLFHSCPVFVFLLLPRTLHDRVTLHTSHADTVFLFRGSFRKWECCNFNWLLYQQCCIVHRLMIMSAPSHLSRPTRWTSTPSPFELSLATPSPALLSGFPLPHHQV